MNSKIVLLLISLVLVLSASAQQVKISGKVIDARDSTYIEFANISLLTQDSVFIKGIVSDESGSFVVNNDKGNYLLSVSYVGYETLCTPIDQLTADRNIGSIGLHPSSISLADVTITGQSVINKADRKLITPSQIQIEGSTDGLDLLRKLQLSRIIINPLTNAVAMSGNGEVQLRINGVKVTNAEVVALRPDEIVRIEYHDDPGVRYGNVAAVIDYITRRSISGGNINGNMTNHPGQKLGFAEDHLSAKFNHKKSEFSVNSYYHYRKLNWTRENSETFFFPDNELHRMDVGVPTLVKESSINTSLNYSLMEKDKYFFNATFRYNYKDMPNSFSDRQGEITTSNNAAPLSIYDHSTEKGNSPALDLYYQHQLKNDQLLIFNVVGTYIDSKNTRLYQEHREEKPVTDIFSDISGDKYSLIAEGIYERKLGKGKLTTGLKHVQMYANNVYAGTTAANVAMRQAESYGYAEYQLKVGKFSYMANLTAIRFYYSQADSKQEKYTLQPAARITYNPNDNTYFRYRINVWNNIPSLSNLNNVEQAIDSLQIRRGNPFLNSNRTISQNLSAGYNKGIFGVDFQAKYSYQSKPVMESILFENDKFVRTYFNQRSHTHFNIGATFKLKPWKEYITISANPVLNHYVSKGNDYSHKHTQLYFGGSIQGMYKGWMAYFEAYLPWDYMYGEQKEGGEKIHTIMLGYNKPKWSVMGGIFNPFGGTYRRQDENWSALNPVKSKVYTEALTQAFIVKVSFNLDFGRQFGGGNKRINNSDTDSGLMSGAKK